MTQRKLRGLIVEDDQTLAEMLTEQFTRKGFEMSVAYSGNSAIPILQAQFLDFVITDMQMPDGNGRVVLEFVNKMPSARPTLFVFSGYNDLTEEDIRTFQIRQVFVKPKSVRELLKQVSEALESKNKAA